MSSPQAPVIQCPACIKCGGPTRFVAAEPHPRITQTDLRTFECGACKDTQVLVVPYTKATMSPNEASGHVAA